MNLIKLWIFYVQQNQRIKPSFEMEPNALSRVQMVWNQPTLLFTVHVIGKSMITFKPSDWPADWSSERSKYTPGSLISLQTVHFSSTTLKQTGHFRSAFKKKFDDWKWNILPESFLSCHLLNFRIYLELSIPHPNVHLILKMSWISRNSSFLWYDIIYTGNRSKYHYSTQTPSEWLKRQYKYFGEFSPKTAVEMSQSSKKSYGYI